MDDEQRKRESNKSQWLTAIAEKDAYKVEPEKCLRSCAAYDMARTRIVTFKRANTRAKSSQRVEPKAQNEEATTAFHRIFQQQPPPARRRQSQISGKCYGKMSPPSTDIEAGETWSSGCLSRDAAAVQKPCRTLD
jgi:hypothetical protein